MPYQPPAGNPDIHSRTTGELLQELCRLRAEAAKQACRPCAATRNWLYLCCWYSILPRLAVYIPLHLHLGLILPRGACSHQLCEEDCCGA